MSGPAKSLSPEVEAQIDSILAEVKAELVRAATKHGPMKSPHECFGIIYEEFNIEYAEEMKNNDNARMREELVQVAAMGCRGVLDLFS